MKGEIIAFVLPVLLFLLTFSAESTQSLTKRPFHRLPGYNTRPKRSTENDNEEMSDGEIKILQHFFGFKDLVLKMAEDISVTGDQLSDVLNGQAEIREKSDQLERKVEQLSKDLSLVTNTSVSNSKILRRFGSIFNMVEKTAPAPQIIMTKLTSTSTTPVPDILNVNSTSSHAAERKAREIQEYGAIHGRISSPNHPNNYNSNTDRTWNISAPTGHKIRITLEYIALESCSNCNCDFVQIHEVDSGAILLKQCGSNYSRNHIVSNSSELIVRFKTDGSESGAGFSLFYESYSVYLPELVPHISFYLENHFRGPVLRANITENICHNFPLPYQKKVHSLNTGDRCIKLYFKSNCTGDYTRIYPGDSNVHVRLGEAIRAKTESYSSCLF